MFIAQFIHSSTYDKIHKNFQPKCEMQTMHKTIFKLVITKELVRRNIKVDTVLCQTAQPALYNTFLFQSDCSSWVKLASFHLQYFELREVAKRRLVCLAQPTLYNITRLLIQLLPLLGPNALARKCAREYALMRNASTYISA